MEQQAQHEESLLGRLPPGLFVALALVVTFAVHAEALSAARVWDDASLLGWTAGASSPREILSRPYFGDYFRPLTSLTFWLQSNSSDAALHLVNLLLHLVNVTLVVRLARSLNAGAWSSLFAGAFFGVLPRLTEAVTWISGRSDLLVTTFALLTLLGATTNVRANPTTESTSPAPTATRDPGALFVPLWVALALASKETGLALVPIALWQLLRRDPLAVPEQGAATGAAAKAGTAVRLGAAAGTVVGAAGYWVLRTQALDGATPVRVVLGGPAEHLQASLESLGRAALDLVLASGSATIQGSPTDHHLGFMVLGGSASVAAAMFVLIHARSRRLGGLVRSPRAPSLVLALLAVALVLPLTSRPINVSFADRFLYLPGALLLATVAGLLEPRGRPVRVRTWAWIPLLLVSLGLSTHLRTEDYGHSLRFWARATQHSGGERLIALSNLGTELVEARAYEDAIVVFRRAQSLSTRGVDRFFSKDDLDSELAAVLTLAGKTSEALRLRRALLERHPNSPSARDDVTRLEGYEALSKERVESDASLDQLEQALAQARSLRWEAETRRLWVLIVGHPECDEACATLAMHGLAAMAPFTEFDGAFAAFVRRFPESPERSSLEERRAERLVTDALVRNERSAWNELR